MRWYVAYAKAHRDGMALFHLQRKAIEVFYPQLLLPDYVEERRRVVPLFPGYLFVRLDLATRYNDVAWCPGVKRLVGPNGVPAEVDEEIVRFLRANASPDGTLQAQPALRVGQEVEIARGPFAGLVGIIQRPPTASGRIRVLMRLLNRRVVKADVPVRHVTPSWVV